MSAVRRVSASARTSPSPFDATPRRSKLRSALTILGVVIGVSTRDGDGDHRATASSDQIVRTIEIAGPTTFYVMKVFSQTPFNPENLPKWVRVRPVLSVAEGERIATLPEIKYAALWGQIFNRVEYGGTRTGLATHHGRG